MPNPDKCHMPYNLKSVQDFLGWLSNQQVYEYVYGTESYCMCGWD